MLLPSSANLKISCTLGETGGNYQKCADNTLSECNDINMYRANFITVGAVEWYELELEHEQGVMREKGYYSTSK